MNRLHLSTIVYVAIFVWATLITVAGSSLPSGWMTPLPRVITFLVVVVFVFERWLWRLPFLYPWFVSQPNLTGTFRAQLASDWTDPDTGESPAVRDGYVVIRQRYSSINVTMLFGESSSESLTATFTTAPSGQWTLVSAYRNTPNPLLLDHSPLHLGTAIFRGHDRAPRSVDGEYWTNRKTRGVLHLRGRSRQLFSTFEAATRGDYT